MISVSKKFKEAKRRDFYVTAQCTLSDGTVLNLKREDFYASGNGIVDSSDSTDFPIGCAIEKTATLSLVNDDDRFSEYNFNAARFVLTLNLDFEDGTSEKIRKGTFIVLKKPATAGKISMTLVDRMHYADRAYTTNLLFPANVREVLRDSCQTCGIQLGDATFPNDDFVINEAPANTTHRAVIGYIAMLAGGNARVDESDRLRIIQFQSDVFAGNIYDGGLFSPWTEGAGLDGGTFDPWTTGAVIDGGTFEEMDKYHVLYKIKGLQVDTDDVLVTGVKMTVDKVDYTYGSEGYVVKIDNPLITGKEQEGVNLIGAQIVGLSMRPFSCDHIADPTATFLDPAYVVDIKQNVYRSYITNIEFAFNGNTKLSNNAKSAEEEVSEFYSSNSVAVEQAKKNTEKMLDEYDISVRNMNEMAANLFGYYTTTDVLDDGSKVEYWHNKPELSESKTVYKKSIDGFFVTQDYQGTDEATSLANKWKAGFDSNGDAVLNILYAIGIVAEWINTRGLTARDNSGNITFRVDADTGKLQITAKDSKGNITFNIDSLTGAVTISPQATVDGETLATKFQVVNGAITAEVTRASDAEGKLSSRITQTESDIKARITRSDAESLIEASADSITSTVTKKINDEKTRAEGAEATLKSSITQTAGEITSEVTRAKGAEEKLGSRITQTDTAITSEVTRAKGAEGKLSSRITQTEEQITSKVSRTDVESLVSSSIDQFADKITLSVTNGKLGSNASIQLSVGGEVAASGSLNLTGVREAFKNDTSAITISAGTITFNSGTFVVNSTYFNVTSSGVITASAGTIGGMTLTGSSIYSGTSSITSKVKGVYLGTDGFRNYYSSSLYTTITEGVLESYGAKLCDVDITNGRIRIQKRTSGGGVLPDGTVEIEPDRPFLDLVPAEVAISLGSSNNMVRIMAIGAPSDGYYGRVRTFDKSRTYYASLDGENIRYGGTCQQASDRRIKKDITPIENEYDAFFDLLEAKSYRLKSDDQKYHIGFISQEVQEAMTAAGIPPEKLSLVSKDEENDLYMLNYIEFIPLIVDEIQKLKKAIKEAA